MQELSQSKTIILKVFESFAMLIEVLLNLKVAAILRLVNRVYRWQGWCIAKISCI